MMEGEMEGKGKQEKGKGEGMERKVRRGD